MRFTAKKDIAFMIPLVAPTAIALVIAAWFLFKNESLVGLVVTGLCLFLFWGIYYFWKNTYYEIKDQRLFYYSGVLKGDILIKKITQISAGTYPVAGNRPALAFNGLVILHSSGSELYISPADIEGLIQELKKVNKKIKVFI